MRDEGRAPPSSIRQGQGNCCDSREVNKEGPPAGLEVTDAVAVPLSEYPKLKILGEICSHIKRTCSDISGVDLIVSVSNPGNAAASKSIDQLVQK